MTAQRIGQGVHRRHRGVGESLAREAGAQQHAFTGLAVAALAHRRTDIARQQAQCLAREVVGKGILLVTGGIGLDGMHHGVHPGHGGDRRRQPQGQVGVQHRRVGQQHGRGNPCLGGFPGGNDRHRGDFRAGAGGSGHQYQRQAPAAHVADAVQLGQGLLSGQQHGHDLGHIHGTAAAHGDHAVYALAASQVRRRQHRGLRRIFPYLVEDNRRKTRLLQGGDKRLYQADGHQSRVGNQQRPAYTLVPALAGQLQGAAAAIDNLANRIELESLHGRCSLVATW